MTVEEIRRGDAWWKITYGYGRIQRVRAIYRNRLPEKARRALVTNPDASLEELFKEIGAEEYSTYGDAVAKDVIAAVLQSAHDWNGTDAGGYMEESLWKMWDWRSSLRCAPCLPAVRPSRTKSKKTSA